mmetsp:Transcript_13373/g.25670  ORF Transcript_13373/g.25670 Transcript_13373/m.25670 type:complete len:264 (+) Transcript_13373:1243-2034(+)
MVELLALDVHLKAAHAPLGPPPRREQLSQRIHPALSAVLVMGGERALQQIAQLLELGLAYKAVIVLVQLRENRLEASDAHLAVSVHALKQPEHLRLTQPRLLSPTQQQIRAHQRRRLDLLLLLYGAGDAVLVGVVHGGEKQVKQQEYAHRQVQNEDERGIPVPVVGRAPDAWVVGGGEEDDERVDGLGIVVERIVPFGCVRKQHLHEPRAEDDIPHQDAQDGGHLGQDAAQHVEVLAHARAHGDEERDSKVPTKHRGRARSQP